MTDAFVIWDDLDDGHTCVLGRAVGILKPWTLTEGRSLASEFPEGARFEMSGERRRMHLTDSLPNLHGLVIVSARLRGFLEAWGVPHVEYLRVGIVDHRGRVTDAEYFILNVVAAAVSLDAAASNARYSPWELPGQPPGIQHIDRLVLDESTIDPKSPLFRVRGLKRPLIVRRDLATAVLESGFTGIHWSRFIHCRG